MLALSGMVVIPAVSDGALAPGTGTVTVSVKPRTGSGRTHFAVSFRAAVTTGRTSHNQYRITAADGTHSGCQASVGSFAAPARAGSTVRVVLSPSGSEHWCAGTFHGQVWDVISEPCPIGEACQALVPVPRHVGKFTFRVSTG